MNREGGCGLRFVIDLHSPPGGRDEAHDMTMFYDKKYADHFIRCWRKIAKRFKGNPAVWGYDLINEPVQMRPAEFDYRNLQRMAAEAIREIDPDTPIIFESNLWDAADTFRSLRPLEMIRCTCTSRWVSRISSQAMILLIPEKSGMRHGTRR